MQSMRSRSTTAPARRPAVVLAIVAVAFGAAPAAAFAASGAETTGRLLVTLDRPANGSGTPTGAMRAAATSLATSEALQLDGAQVPQIGLVSVRPQAGTSLRALARALRHRDGVRRVEVERRYALRTVPNDPALLAPEISPGTPPGTTLEWWIPRLGLPAAWDITRGAGARVAVIDTGIDAQHPELAGKIDKAVDNDRSTRRGPATVDEDGHGTHVASIACAAGDNAIGIVGVGLDCHLLIFKSDLGDGSVANSIIQAADEHADAINMSFGSNGTAAAPQVIVDAIKYAVAHDVVLVAAAAEGDPGRVVEEQGDPANVLQPTGTGADLTAGLGLSVTSADFSNNRSAFAGRGSQISLAAYGSFDPVIGPPGLFAAFPGNTTALETGKPATLVPPSPSVPPCDCRSTFLGDNRYAYLEGTSMASPMVAATAAIVKHFNPDLSAAAVVRLLKETATRPPGTGWTPELGWGIVNPLAALTAAQTIDRRPPTSKLTGPRSPRRAGSITLRWTGADTASAGFIASGVDHYEIYRSTNGARYKRIRRTPLTTLKVAVRTGSRYRFYSIAVDKAGNREPAPKRPDLTSRVARRR